MPSVTPTRFNCFTEDLAEKVHNLGSDALTYALTNTQPVVTNTVIANITQISYTNLSTRVPTLVSSAQVSGVYRLIHQDLTLTAGATNIGPFQWVVLYNATAAGGPLILFMDYGSAITVLAGDTFVIDTDQTEGVVKLT